MQIIETIKKDVDWYNSSYNKATIEQLMDCRTRISTNNMYVAELVADCNINQLRLEAEKENEYYRKANELVNEKMPVAKSVIIAKNHIAAKRELYAESKALFDRIKLIHLQANYVTQDLQQRISVMRKEKEQ